MKLRTQIFAGYALLSLFVLAVGTTGYLSVRTISSHFDEAINRTQPVLTALHEIRLRATTLAFAAMLKAAAPEAGEREQHDASADGPVPGASTGEVQLPGEDDEHGRTSSTGLMAAIGDYRILVEKHFPGEVEDATAIKESAEHLSNAIESLGGGAEPLPAANLRTSLAKVHLALDQLLELIAEAAEGEEEEFREQQQGIDSESDQHMLSVLAVSLIALLAAIGGGAALSTHIAMPVRLLRETARKLGSGDLDSRVEVSSKDEIGELGRAFNQMGANLSRSLVTREYVESIIESLTDGVLVVNTSGRIERSNSAMRRIHDEATMAPLVGSRIEEILEPMGDAQVPRGEIRSRQRVECRLLGGGDTRTIVSVSASPTFSGISGPVHVLLVQDITERKRNEEQLRYLARYDVLTGLPNRRMFLEHLTKTLARLPWNKQHVGVLFCDIDRFKFVNDSLGHGVGDVLLQRVAERIGEVLRPGDIIGRWAGDEFIVLLNEIAHPDHVEKLARKILESLKRPVQIGPHVLTVTVSIGTCCAPEDGLDSDEVVMNADLATYAAKASGKNQFRRYLADMRQRTELRMQLEHGLREAIGAADQLTVHYQPQESLDGALIGFEALVRWQHPQLGLISPAQFLPAAEESGLMAALDECVLRMACSALRRWREAGWGELRIAVNLSNQSFMRTDLVQLVAKVIADTGIPPTALELELTEQIVMHNVETAVATMEELCALGVSLSIDDFGTGYSSLSQLKRCPIRVVKIDRSFITDVVRDDSDEAITLAIIALSHRLGMLVLAEGVETEGQLELLRRNGCDAYQGYLLSKPLAEDSLLPWLEAHRPLACADQGLMHE